MTIGERAVMAIKERAESRGVRISVVMNEMGLSRKSLYDWKHQKIDPTAYPLQQMARMGMDIMWILLGEEATNGQTQNDRAV